MKIEIFAICDAATESGGKLNILGAFDQITTRSVPAVHPLCSLAIRMRFDKTDEGDHQLRIDVVDPDGKSILPPMQAKLTVRVAGEDETVFSHCILNLQELEFANFGQHNIDLYMDGARQSSIPLFVRRAS